MNSRIKYIAKGFLEDAGRLLNDFVEKNSPDFSDFAEVWRNHHFSLVFMGRPDHVEMTEFINEIFRISLQLLSSPSFYQRIGIVYLIYSLFRTQISDIKIRLELTHWKIIKSLRIDAELNKHFTLLYVIDYLIQNAFLYVARQMLKGPMVGSMLKQSKNLEVVSSLKANYKSDFLEYSVSNNFETLRQLHAEYLAEKKKFSNDVKVNLDSSSDAYQMFKSDLQKLVNPDTSKWSENVGSRRAKIKAQSFMRKTCDKFGNANVDDDSDSDSRDREDNAESPRKTRKKESKPKKKVRKEERRIGRPRKYKVEEEKPTEVKSDDVIDITHLLDQQQNLYLPAAETDKTIKRKTKRDPYYKLFPTPKREEKSEEKCSDDPDNPE